MFPNPWSVNIWKLFEFLWDGLSFFFFYICVFFVAFVGLGSYIMLGFVKDVWTFGFGNLNKKGDLKKKNVVPIFVLKFENWMI